MQKSDHCAAAISIDPDPDPPPHKAASPSGFLWSSLFADSASFNAPSSSPTYLPDGTPVVLAPPSVILKASSSWIGHILYRFLGEPPSPAKFYSDLNRIWGKQGDISVRRFSSGTFLVYVPSAGIRKWILQTGLWSSGTVSFVVSEWSVSPSLAPPSKLTSATTLLTISGIPPQLWSHEAVARIAGGVAKLIPDTRASLPRSSLGTATIRAIVPLGAPLSPVVLVKDLNGDSVRVSIDYGKLPHLCPTCKSYGHQSHRCPLRSVSVGSSKQSSASAAEMDVDGSLSNSDDLPNLQQSPSPVKSLPQNLQPPSMIQEKQLSHNNSDSSLSGNHSAQIFPVLDISSYPAAEMEVDRLLTTSDELPTLQEPSSPAIPSPKSSQSHPMLHEKQNPPINSAPSLSETPSDQQALVPDITQPQHIFRVKQDSQNPSAPAAVQVFSSIPKADDLVLIESLGSHVTPALSCDQTTHHTETANQTPPSSDQASFEFPPPLSHALNCDIVPSYTPPSQSVSQPQHEGLSSPTDKRDQFRDKRKANSKAKHSLRCVQVNHQFKPKGVIEKRRKKADHDQVPTDEEVQECLQQLQSDKKDTLYFEAIDAHKVLRNQVPKNHDTIVT